MMAMSESKKILTEKDLNVMSWRFILGSQLNWNYERMMSSGYLFGMLPGLKKLYKDNPEEYKDMLHTHNQFFNTNGIFGNLIMGIDLAIEEADGYKAKETIVALKTALMGSFAGIGDSLFHVIWGTVFGSLAATLAMNGSPIGIFIWVIANLVLVFFQSRLLHLGYKQGVKLVTVMKDKLNAFTDAALILGITVIGALAPTIVRTTVPFVYKHNGVKLVIQDTLDMILPNLVPVLLVGLAYWLLGRKKMNSTRVIVFFLILSIVLYNLKILG
ncbi:PTS system mannose/fructose/sorbose family transporter subunit IID [Enterococcus faecalis]|uniref:PTS system mannose/fructose/sorbose family transporter subunit IID n=1 Tax=Enterococcus TaxID=1350 RepID=UPI0015720050|nr:MULTISPECIES: PTS system mannose/fructose/sorbose family transporter subunit IID [Enterococcus]EIQ7138442.1 PTS system mannose/fructose/sorbose family transporter subunit IID [Enterococcus faecalis]EJF8946147.1 PTS system mannose/fructose/sorbose family transporter subunit IID [Enterococcus faecalis]EKB7629001.1 PTS system mannose/fructose/sorbose family transporter subunit IID [Enterococcus faecalis]MBO1126488.1 PTS system mannose/fructose/sorbose family transporter subunit IID [Enterococcu